MKHRQQGYTLTELILVIVVLGLLAGIAVPRLNDKQGIDEMAVKDTVKGMLFTARKLAMSQRRDVCFVHAINGGVSQARLVYFDAGPCAWGNTPVKELGGDTNGDFLVELPAGVIFSNANVVHFTARGQLAPNANVTLTVGSTPSLTVVGETGFTF